LELDQPGIYDFYKAQHDHTSLTEGGIVFGVSGYSGIGISGYSGYSGIGGSGYSGKSGYSGSGISGYSGFLPITISEDLPSGGVDGDVWFQYI